MRIFQDLSEVTHDKNTIITLGTFDGVHVGHRFIIEEVVKKASDLGGRSFLITYHPHPRKVITGQNQILLLSTPSEKIKIFKSLGIENLLIINFTKNFSQLKPEKFIDKFVVKGIGTKQIVIGYDHHFGKGRGGNKDFLRNMGNKSGFDVTIIPEYKMEESQFMDRLQAALEKLTDAQRTAFLMNRVEGKKHREIAEILGISTKAVEKRLYGAIKKIKEDIKEFK